MLLKNSKTADPQDFKRAECDLTQPRLCKILFAFLLLAGSASAATFPVSMTDFAFTPANQTINVGDTVTWNGVADSHTATSGTGGTPSGVWDSGNIDPGGAYSFTFTAAGNYPYFCAYHLTLGMIGSITVVAGNTPPVVDIIDPTNGASFTAGSNIPVQAAASDSDGTVVRVDFFSNSVGLGSLTNLPYAVMLTNAASGQYALTAVATDDQGASTTSSVVNITVVAGNVPPSIAITNPVDGQNFFVGDTVLVQAAASDSDGSVTQVVFLVNTNPVAVVASPPYDVALTNLTAGSYVLTAVATDNQGATTTSTNVNVAVIVPTQAPTILIPPLSQTATVGQTVTLNVTVGGTPPFFYDWQFGGTDIPGATSNALVLSNIQTNQAGDYRVIVTNSAGSVTSQVATLTVNLPADILPVVSITTPASAARFALNVPILISADATDSDGVVTQVEFFAGSTSVGVVTNSPYSVIVSNLPAGGINLTARATDNRGGTTASTAVAITVVSPPTVTLTQPTNGAAFSVGATVSLLANARSVGATITNVEFLAGSMVLGTAMTPPFTLNWSPVTAGPVVLTAIAQDDLGQMTLSATVGVRAYLPDNQPPSLRIIDSPPNFGRLNGGTITLSGTASDDVGLDRVEFHVNHGAFQPAAGTSSWNAQIALSPGMNVVGIRAVDLAGNASPEMIRYFNFVVSARLDLQVAGSGTVTPSLGNRMLVIGQSYRLIAKPGQGQIFAGWSGDVTNPASRLSFQMRSNMQLTATFIPSPFLNVAGNYAGLVLNTNGAYPANSAAMNLRVTSMGSFSGKLMMNGFTLPFIGQMDVNGSAHLPVLRRGKVPIFLAMQLGLDSPSGQLTGSATDGTWTSPMFAVRTVSGPGVQPGPQGARRVIVLTQTAAEGGAAVGQAVANIADNGIVSIRGSLVDLRSFAVAAMMSADGQVPFYAAFDHGSEMLTGWLQLDLHGAMPVNGTVIWAKAQTNGFSQVLEATQP